MRVVSFLSLALAVFSSVATSRSGPPSPQSGVDFPTPVLLNVSGAPVAVEVRLALDVDCEVIGAAPWLAPGLAFVGTADRFELGVDEERELIDGTIAEELAATNLGCYAAELRTGDRVMVALITAQVWQDGSIPRPGERLLMVDPEHADGFFNDGGLLHHPDDAQECDEVDVPTWSGSLSGDTVFVGQTSEGDCSVLHFEEGDLSVCGVRVPFLSGDRVSIRNDADGLDVVDSRGVRLWLGGVPGDLGKHTRIVPLSQGRCLTFGVCGPGLSSQLEIDGVVVPGEGMDFEDGHLTVSQAMLPLHTGCGPEVAFHWVREKSR